MSFTKINTPVNRVRFKEVCVAWLNHKMILSEKSFHFTQAERKKAMQWVRNYFSEFCMNPQTFSCEKVARMFIKNADKMREILPHPENPSYKNSESILEQIFEQSRLILMAE